jgi:1-acyl-sn-glycerol-3-phosphate acyltransferase
MTFDRWRRVVGTGLSFAFFGVGSLALGVVATPLLWLAVRDRGRRERAMQRLIHHGFRVFVRLMEGVGVIAVEIRQPGRLAPAGQLLIANHPTLIDYVLLVAHLPQADVVVKRAHWSNPFTAGTVRGAGYVPNDTGEATLEACAARIRAGRTVLLFPEGTRSPRDALGSFQRGAAHVALATGVDARPVTIHCEPRGLMRDQPWYDVPERRMQFVLDVGEPIATPTDGEPRGRAARRLTGQYREHFHKSLERGHG